MMPSEIASRSALPARSVPPISSPFDSLGDANFVAAMVIVGCALIGMRIFGLLYFGDFWIDDAMLAVNVRDVSSAALLQPLPYFEQSSPIGFLIAAKAVAASLHYDETSFRLLPNLALLLAFPATYLACRLRFPRYASLLAATLACLSSFIAIYSFSFKHYTVELLFSALSLFGFLLVLQRGFKFSALAVFGLIFIASIPFSDSQPLLLAGFGFALFVAALAERRLRWDGAVGLVVVGLAGAVVWLVFYKTLLQASVYYQVSGEGYQDGIAPLPVSLDAVEWYMTYAFNIVALPFFPQKGYLSYPVLALALIVLVVGLRAVGRVCWPLALGYLTTIVLMLVLARLALFLPHAGKHFIFLAPYTAVILSFGILDLLGRGTSVATRLGLPSRAAGWVPFLAIVLVVVIHVGMAVVRIAFFPREQIQPLFAAIAASGLKEPAWVVYSAQPATEFYRDELPGGYFGKVDHRSSIPGWEQKAQDRTGTDAVAFGGLVKSCGASWLVYTSHNDGEAEYKRKFLAAVDGGGGSCTLRLRTKGIGELYLCVADPAAAPPQAATSLPGCTP